MAVDLATLALAVDDLTLGINKGDLRRTEAHDGVGIGGCIVAQRNHTELAVEELYTQLGEDLLHLILVEDAIHKVVFQRLLRQCYGQLVGQAVEFINSDVARLGNTLADGLPNGVDQQLYLLAILGRHLLIHKGLDRALEAARGGAEDLGLHA